LIEKRNENSQRLKLLQDLENNLAVLSHEVKTTQNLATKKEITTWLNHTLKTTIKLSYVKNSSQLRIRIFQNVSRLLLLLKDYHALESYLKSCLIEFEKDRLFTKQTHEVKLQLLVYLCNASYMLEKHTQAVQYASVLHKALFEFDKLLYDQYIFYYYNILVNNYSKTNLSKAIDTLEAAQNEKQIKNNPHQYFYVLNNLAILNFDLKKYKQAGKFFSQMYVSQNFKSLDILFVVKLYVFELINRIEMEDYEQCDKQLGQLYKLLDDVKEKETVKIDLAMVDILDLFLNKFEKRWRPLKTTIQSFAKRFQNSTEGNGLIDYKQWIESKI
jgi:tetratricopeptide (TPR) repeat protein